MDNKQIKKISKDLFDYYNFKNKKWCLKIFFSQEFSSDYDAYYVSKEIMLKTGFINKYYKKSGTIRSKISVSNILSLYDVSPKIYDSGILKIKNKKYIFQIVESYPSILHGSKEPEIFMKKLMEVLNKEKILIEGSEGVNHIDFKPLLYKNNICTNDDNEIRYVDMQKFVFNDLKNNISSMLPKIKEITHFGDEHEQFGGKYSYQSIPELGVFGKRDMKLRISLIMDLLKKYNINIKDKVVFDIGCNFAGFCPPFLSKEAKWYMGADIPENIKLAKKYLYYNSFSRFDLYGCDLKKYPKDILNNHKKIDIILFLSMSKHIGVPSWLNEIDYSILIYEGHNNESEEHTRKLLKDNLKDIEEPIYIKNVKDYPFSDERPFFVCLKKDMKKWKKINKRSDAFLDFYIINGQHLNSKFLFNKLHEYWTKYRYFSEISKFIGLNDLSFKEKIILDIGCGQTSVLNILPYCKKYGIDIVIEDLKRNKFPLDDKIKWINSEAEKLPFEEKNLILFFAVMGLTIMNIRKK